MMKETPDNYQGFLFMVIVNLSLFHFYIKENDYEHGQNFFTR